MGHLAARIVVERLSEKAPTDQRRTGEREHYSEGYVSHSFQVKHAFNESATRLVKSTHSRQIQAGFAALLSGSGGARETSDVEKPLSPRPASPIGLVLSGGGARGAFQVGVWSVIREHGIGRDPDVVSGSSAGALNAALIGAGLTPREMLDFWLGLADKPPVVANTEFFRSLQSGLMKLLAREPIRSLKARGRDLRLGWSSVRRHGIFSSEGRMASFVEYLLTARFDAVSHVLEGITATSVFDTDPLRERLTKLLGGTSIKRTGVRLAINTVDVRTGGVIRIVNYEPKKRSARAAAHYRYHPEITVDMVLASSSIPLLFNPVNVGNELLWDGGLLVNTPIAPAVALGAHRIIPVLVTAGGAGTPADVPNFGVAVERLADAFLENAYVTDRKLLLDRNALVGKKPGDDLRAVELFEAIRPETSRAFNAGSYLYFERNALLSMYDAGRKAAFDWLARGPVVDQDSSI